MMDREGVGRVEGKALVDSVAEEWAVGRALVEVMEVVGCMAVVAEEEGEMVVAVVWEGGAKEVVA